MQRVKLDRIDMQILTDLQQNGRITNVDLANKAGISAPPCLRRVRALEEAGFIRGYSADLDPALLGFNVSVYANIGLISQAKDDLLAFEEMVSEWSEVRECHMLAGEADFLLRIVSRDWDEYQKFVTSKLTSAPNVAQVKSSLAIRSSKRLQGVPLDKSNQ